MTHDLKHPVVGSFSLAGLTALADTQQKRQKKSFSRLLPLSHTFQHGHSNQQIMSLQSHGMAYLLCTDLITFKSYSL